MSYYLQGLTVTLASVAPIGMQNLFMISSAASFTRRQAFITAAIVILFDVSLALSAFFGMGALIEKWPLLRLCVLGAGSVFVLKIGTGLIFSKAEDIQSKKREFSLKKITAAAFAVAWLNPQALVDTTLYFGAFRSSLPPEAILPFICGCMTASPLWFLSITLAVSTFSSKIGPKFLRILNLICGTVTLFYGTKLLRDFIRLVLDM
jgi:L-lysine exporter family protein LysE/ArgO